MKKDDDLQNDVDSRVIAQTETTHDYGAADTLKDTNVEIVSKSK